MISQKNKCLHTVLVVFWGLIVHVQAGDYGASFMNIGAGARALAMGGAFHANAADASAFYWNPAGAAYLRRFTLSGMYGQQFGTIQNPMANYSHAGVCLPISQTATLSVNWIRLTVDEIPIYGDLRGGSFLERQQNIALRPTGDPRGYFSDVEDAFCFSFANFLVRQMDMGWSYHVVRIEIPVGINIRWIRQTLYNYSAHGLAIDMGAMVRLYLSDLYESAYLGNVTFGVNIKDFSSTQIKWNTRHVDKIPLNVKWQVSYLQPLPLRGHSLLIAFDHDTQWRGENHLGIEYDIAGQLFLRAGMHNRKFSSGAGMKVWKLGLDYAFITHELDHLHRITCTIQL